MIEPLLLPSQPVISGQRELESNFVTANEMYCISIRAFLCCPHLHHIPLGPSSPPHALYLCSGLSEFGIFCVQLKNFTCAPCPSVQVRLVIPFVLISVNPLICLVLIAANCYLHLCALQPFLTLMTCLTAVKKLPVHQF